MVKYCDEVVNEICTHIRSGSTQREAHKKAGISHDAFYTWLKTKADFAEKVKKAKEEFLSSRVEELEKSLFKRALGFEYTEKETEYVSDADGTQRIKSKKQKQKYYAPDVGALVFALTNLAPERWKNKMTRESNISGSVTTSVKSDFDISAIPDEELFKIADILQNDKKKRQEKEKNGAKKDGMVR